MSYIPYMAYAQYNNRLVVKDPKGESIPYVGAWSGDQMEENASHLTLESGTSVTICTIDLAAAYHIVHQGRYTLQYSGEFIPKSDPIEVMVEPGHVSEADEVVDRLLKEFMTGWNLEKVLPHDASPQGFRLPHGVVEVRLCEGRPGYGMTPIIVWQVRQPVDLATVQDAWSATIPLEYLGQNRWGAVYARDSAQVSVIEELSQKRNRPLGVLPRVRKRLMRALEIRIKANP